MDTSKLKRFAPECREQLMEQVGVKLDYVLTTRTPDLAEQENLVKALQKAIDSEGRDAVIERVAYTWFNRLAALRYLDARGWHPFRMRVLTPANEDETQPELLRQVRQGVIPDELKDFVSANRVNALLDGKLPSDNPQAEVQRLLVIGVCQYYAGLLPDLFERLDDFSQLLLPDDLLTEHSVVHGFQTEISDEDCAEVEVLGWLYQFYISEKKDEVMARKKAVPSEDIPAVTQLFTPHWIVRYLVENSLGRLWLRSKPDSRLREHMPYYVEDPAPEPPAWEPEWTEKGIDHREGDYRTLLWLRPNPDLAGDYEKNLRYAMSIDGYQYARDKWGIDATSGEGVPKLEEFEAMGWDKVGFEDLRFCLHLVQRGIKWSDDRDGTLTEKYHAIYDALCKAWGREWRKHEADLPDLARYGIRMPEAAPADSLTVATPEEIKLLDPACGSGHMLTYAFDLLVKIYEEEGHAPSEIPEKILTHNLFGLEICPRAAQLAQFALVCKAREQSRAAFRRPVQPQVMCLRDVVITADEMQAWCEATGVRLNQDELSQEHQFRENTQTFGSLIQPVLDVEGLAALREKIGEEAAGGDLLLQNTQRKLRLVVDQAEMLSQRYQVVVANPPYMGGRQMNLVMQDFARTNFPDSKADAYAMFLERGFSLARTAGFAAMVTMETWMFLSSFSGLRDSVLSNQTIIRALHMPYLGKGGTSMGINFGTVASVFLNRSNPEQKGVFHGIRHFETDDAGIPLRFPPENELTGKVSSKEFQLVPGMPIAYWASDQIRKCFTELKLLEDFGAPKQGATTSNNNRFLRLWPEVASEKIGFGCSSRSEAKNTKRKWFPYNKGGDYRRWWGNQEFVINYANDGEEIKEFHEELNKLRPGGRLKNQNLYFRECVSWSKVTSGRFSIRYFPPGFIFDVAGSAIFTESSELTATIGSILNSSVSDAFLRVLSATLNYEAEQLRKIPIPKGAQSDPDYLRPFQNLVSIARTDWDNFETSWDFHDLPLLRPGDWEVEPGQPGGSSKGRTLAESWANYAAYCTAAIRRMQELETENNRLWIDAYGLQDELTPEVPEDEITLARADEKTDMIAFVSYAVGCMMGRYSLDQPGLILADAGDTLEQYFEKVGKSADEVTFLPDDDAIIPITEDDWFEDDAASRVREFLRVTFGKETLEENVAFLEESLGKDLRKYFTANTGGFYADHVKTYKKRPIYWMFESPKKHFRALVYLHRYTRDTVNTLLNGYLREFHHKLTARIDDLQHTIDSASTSAGDKTRAQKALDKAQAALRDVEEYERDILLPLAPQRLKIDLDDGVKANYPKFGKALAKVSGLS